MEQEEGRDSRKVEGASTFQCFSLHGGAVSGISGTRRRVLTRRRLALQFTALPARGHATPKVICRGLLALMHSLVVGAITHLESWRRTPKFALSPGQPQPALGAQSAPGLQV
jgi:hypothetical protein